MKKDTVKLNDTELENITGGKAPDLPATQLESSEYSGMFPNPQGPGQYDIHIYDGGIADPEYFIGKIKVNENE